MEALPAAEIKEEAQSLLGADSEPYTEEEQEDKTKFMNLVERELENYGDRLFAGYLRGS